MFETFDAFLGMAGYGFFVWTSYAICFGSLSALCGISLMTARQRKRELDYLEQLRGQRREPSSDHGGPS